MGLTLCGSLLVAGAASADSFTLKVDGSKQGGFKGSAPDGSSILASGMELSAVVPRDAASGQASGRRRWEPLKIVKSVDKASPTFFTALITNELLKTVSLRAFHGGPTGASYYTVTLTNATIVSFRQYKADPANPSSALLEEVSFSFQKIQVVSDEGGTTSTPDDATH